MGTKVEYFFQRVKISYITCRGMYFQADGRHFPHKFFSGFVAHPASRKQKQMPCTLRCQPSSYASTLAPQASCNDISTILVKRPWRFWFQYCLSFISIEMASIDDQGLPKLEHHGQFQQQLYPGSFRFADAEMHSRPDLLESSSAALRSEGLSG